MRVLFLGNDANPFSVACLERLLAWGRAGILVGIDDQLGARFFATAWRALRERGPGFLGRKGVTLLRTRTRLGLRRLGMRFPGSASLSEVAWTYRVTVVGARQVNTPRAVNRLRSLDLDVIVMAGFSQILRPPVISVPRLGCLNVHPSLLPKYRGPNPFYWVLTRGERMTGVTVHHVDVGVDSGDIILQEEIAIRPGETERTLQARSAQLAGELIVEALKLLAAGRAPRVKQDEHQATYYGLARQSRL